MFRCAESDATCRGFKNEDEVFGRTQALAGLEADVSVLSLDSTSMNEAGSSQKPCLDAHIIDEALTLEGRAGEVDQTSESARACAAIQTADPLI